MNRYGLLATFLIAVAMNAWDEMKVKQRVPQPQRFVYIAVVWGVLGIVAEMGAPDLAAVFGAGMVLALAYTHFNASQTAPNVGVNPKETRPLPAK